MTRGELAAIRAVDPREVVVRELADGRVEVSGLGQRCAYYEDGCRVYAVRPGVCRAFGCFGGDGTLAGMLGRMAESAGVRRVALTMGDEAEAWTAGHP